MRQIGIPEIEDIALGAALLGAGVKRSSLHIFPHGGHGIALRSQPGSTALWPQIAEEWLRETGFAGK